MKVQYVVDDGTIFNTEQEAKNYEAQLVARAVSSKKEVIELLNQIMFKLMLVKEVELDDEDLVGFTEVNNLKGPWGEDKSMGSLKVIIKALISDLESDSARDLEKLARAYYTSFCNA